MNIPNSQLDISSNIMLVGIGGRFDVFTGLPFVYHWPDKNFVLVNSGPNDLFHVLPSATNNYPEGLIGPRKNIIQKYTVGRHGYRFVKSAYDKIITDHNIDCILAIDGGVDSLAAGDEEDSGTILEDFIAIAAISDVTITNKILCCAGFGTETEENMNHFRILENMAAFAAAGSFLGSFSLTKNLPEFHEYVSGPGF